MSARFELWCDRCGRPIAANFLALYCTRCGPHQDDGRPS